MRPVGVGVLLFIVAMGGLIGCTLPGIQRTAEASQPAQYGTVAAMLTSTAVQQTPSPSDSPATANAATNTPEPTMATRGVESAATTRIFPSATSICDLAKAGVPIDVTIPDDSKLRPGETFVKTWRLVNAGSCSWTHNYALVWFSGDDIGVRQAETFGMNVLPGSTIDLSVDMIAPERPGTYQSNWKLRNPSGALFGIGPGGGAPFWVRIQVVAADTPTPTQPAPTLTATVPVSRSGNALLVAGEGFDFDSGIAGTGSEADVLLEESGEVLVYRPGTGARAALFGIVEPSLKDCQSAALHPDTIALMEELQGFYLCVQTNLGLPGHVKINQLDESARQLDLSYTVWSVP